MIRSSPGRSTAAAAAILVAVASTAPGEEIAPPERLQEIDRSLLSHTFAEGSFSPEYQPPAPGTYRLPPIAQVEDHPLIDTAGKRTSLRAVQKDRLAIVAFIYTTCSEISGCPLSQAVLRRVDRELAGEAALGDNAVLISVSFDPQRDTPARLREVRSFYEPKADWRFVTTAGDAELRPLLEDFGQDVHKLRFEDGTWSGLYRHVLKAFLLDREHRIRNIYSVGFLNAELLLNDLRTLLAEEGSRTHESKAVRERGPVSVTPLP